MSQKSSIENNSNKRIYQIDLFRFLAALSVVLFHYLFRGSADDLSELHFIEIGEYFKYGYLGVDLFFIISGFVITLSIKSRSLNSFLISRVSRLYPSYWLCVIITSVVIYFFGSPRFIVNLKQIIVNLTMFQNYLRIPSIDGVYWSLFVEMKFYLFVICTYLILNKIKQIKLDYVIYSWMILSILYVFLNHLLFFKILSSLLAFKWSSYFIAGMIFFQIFKNNLNIRYFVFLCITFAISIFHAIQRIEVLELQFNTTFSPIYIGGYIFLFYALMLLVSCGKLKIINSSKLIKLGLLTYPLYLLHQNIGFIIFNNLGTESNKYIIVFSTIILMLSISYVISLFYEPLVSGFIKTKLKQLKWPVEIANLMRTKG